MIVARVSIVRRTAGTAEAVRKRESALAVAILSTLKPFALSTEMFRSKRRKSGDGKGVFMRAPALAAGRIGPPPEKFRRKPG